MFRRRSTKAAKEGGEEKSGEGATTEERGREGRRPLEVLSSLLELPATPEVEVVSRLVERPQEVVTDFLPR